MKLIDPTPFAKPLYRTLGIREDATQEQIREAFLRIARHSHPDVNGGQSEDFLKAQHAYQILSDSAAREQYDATGIDPAETLGAIQQAATARIVAAAFAVIADGKTSNLLAHIRAALDRDREQLKTELRNYDAAISQAKTAAADIEKRWKGAEQVRDAIVGMIHTQSAKDAANRATAAQKLEVIKTATRLLEPATYEGQAETAQFDSWQLISMLGARYR